MLSNGAVLCWAKQLVTFWIHVSNNSRKKHHHIVDKENVQIDKQCSLDLHLNRDGLFFVLVLQEVILLIFTGLLFLLILLFHVYFYCQEFGERAWYLICFEHFLWDQNVVVELRIPLLDISSDARILNIQARKAKLDISHIRQRLYRHLNWEPLHSKYSDRQPVGLGLYSGRLVNR